MTQVAKLYARLLANPRGALPFRDFERLLAAFGFELDRTKGSHRQYVYPTIPWVLTVLPDGKCAKTYQVRRFLDIIDEYDLSMSE